MTTAEGLYRALVRASIPVISVRIGRDTDRTTWQIEYATDATTEQRDAGEVLRGTYTVAADVTAREEDMVARMQASDYATLVIYLAAMQAKAPETVREELLNIFRELPQ